MGDLTWRKSTYSGGQGGNCVEVAAAGTVHVRDTTDRDGVALAVPAAESGISNPRKGEISVMTGGAAPPRYRIGISANVINLMNHTNYTGYAGTMTSPFFLQPQNVQSMRKIDISLNFSF